MVLLLLVFFCARVASPPVRAFVCLFLFAGSSPIFSAEAEALHQHPGDLGHVRVGIGVGGSTTDHHQQGVGEGDIVRGLIEAFLNPGSDGRHHQAIDAQFPPVVDRQAGFRCVGVENGGDVVLGMPRGEKHGWNGQHPGDSLLPKRLKAIPKDGTGKFEITVFDRHRSEPWSQGLHHLRELFNGQSVSAAMAADQNAKLLLAAFRVLFGQKVALLFQWTDDIGRIAMDSGRPVFFNAQAADARRSGLLSPRPEELVPFVQNWSGPRPLRLCGGGTTSRAAVAHNWTLDLQTHFKRLDWQPEDQSVWIGAGCRMGEVLEALLPCGRTVAAGLSGLPGLGYVLTGGMGPLSRQVGLAVDQVLEIHGVWGDGSPFALSRAADAGSLEWRSLCGAAPFLGVVSELRISTQPLVPLSSS